MKRMYKQALLGMAAVVLMTPVLTVQSVMAAEAAADVAVDTSQISADEAIQSVYALGFVDADGAKLRAIAIEYGVELQPDAVTLDDYEIEDYGTYAAPACELGTDPGKPVNIYINDRPEVSDGGGVASGKYVIIEVNTDYQMGAVVSDYTAAVAVSAEQTTEIIAADGIRISPSTVPVVNYEEVESERRGETTISHLAKEGTYSFEIIENYQLFYKGEGAFEATDCFEEATGETIDLELPYALYVPEDYDPSGNYGLVLHIEDAGFLGEDSMIVLTESQSPANFASAELQEYFKEESGMDGLIVLCPQIEQEYRTTRDNWSISAGVPATWQLVDYITSEYSIDENYIYGAGQSMGGMQILAMATQRDNYFAGLWLAGSQWGNCYNLEQPYGSFGADPVSYYPSTDDTIWRTDADGNSTVETIGDTEYLARNMYYLISDDNILATTCAGDAFATTVWKEIWYLFNDIGSVQIPTASVEPLEDTVEEMNETLNALVSDENDTGIYWLSQEGGSHMLTWVYAYKMDAGYYWLLSQSRQTEMERSKIAQMSNAWAEADEATTAAVNEADEGRVIGQLNEENVYFAVPAEGAGTSGYNSGWYEQGSPVEGKLPGWTVE